MPADTTFARSASAAGCNCYDQSQWKSATFNALCPVDRTTEFNFVSLQTEESLLPKDVREMLSELRIICSHVGCGKYLQLDKISNHEKVKCKWRFSGTFKGHVKLVNLKVLYFQGCPKKPVTCLRGCGLTLTQKEMSDHDDCIRDLRAEHEALKERVESMAREVEQMRKGKP